MSHQLVHLMMTQGWQIAVLAAIVAMLTRMMARRRPHLAHGLWMLVLIKCVTPPIWGHSLGLFSWLPAAAFETTDSLRATGRVVLARPAYQADWPMPHPDAESDIPATRDLAGSSNASDTGNTTLSNLDIAAERGYGRLSGRKSESAALSRPAGWRRISWYQGVLALVWSGAMVTAGLMVVRYVRCLRLIHRRRTNEFDAMLDERLRSLTKRLGLRRIPRVIVSDERFGPAVLGLLRQTIVLPRCLLAAPGGSDLPGEQNVGYLDAILAHELIHIRRGDLYTGTLQAVAQSLWWFHPAVWICNRGLSRESERCCDEQVIAELECSPAQYARSLLAVIECRHQLQPVPVFPGMKPVEITTQRMERIMSLRNGLRKRTPIGYWVVVAALAIVVLPGAMAKPQTDEEVPTEIPNAASDPGRTAHVAAPPIQVSTRTYDVGDLVARLAEDRSQSPEQARTNLLKMLDVLVSPELEFVPELPGLPATSMPAAAVPAAPMPTTAMPALPSIRRISNARMIRKRSSLAMHADRLIVIHSDAGHRELQNHIARIREFGFTPFEITARCFRAPVDRMHSLMSSFGLEAPLVEAESANPTSSSAKPADASRPDMKGHQIGKTIILSREQIREIEARADSKAEEFTVQSSQVMTVNGQQATIHLGETIPFIVGFEENDEPRIRTVTEGPTLQVTPTIIDSGLYRLQFVSRLEEVSRLQRVSVARGGSETPRTIRVPAITTRQMQTTVELRDDQALLQSGLITTHEGPPEAVLIILNARTVSPELAMADGVADGSSDHAAADLSSRTTDAVPAAAEPEKPRLVITYSVADLVAPSGRSITGNDYLPLVELLRTSVNPESWGTGGGMIVADEESRALVIRQTRPAHEAILQLLRQLRKAHDSIQISCLLMKLSTDSQREGLAERCSLHPLNDQQRWALLTRNRGDEIVQFLTDQSATVLSRPRIITISGQAAMMEIGSLVNGQLTGFRLSATPQVIADGQVIRLSHSVTIGALNKTAQAAVHESLLGSGQTLLLLVEQSAGATVDRYVVLLTPESIEEEEDQEEEAL